MKKYKLMTVTDLEGKTKIDEHSLKRMGSIYTIAILEKDRSTSLLYVKDNKGKDKEGMLITSPVKEILSTKEGGFIITTLNSIYVLIEVE